jgi:GntR family transcriptional regulator
MKPWFLTVDPNDRRPAYQQIAVGVKELIARGELTEGMALPSVRQIAGDLGVNFNTVATAYRELQEEGLITVKPGSGAVVTSRTAAGKPEELARSLRTALLNLILSGVPRAQIRGLVADQLRELGVGVKGDGR